MSEAQRGNVIAIAILKQQGLYAERVLDVKVDLKADTIATITVVYAIDKSLIDKDEANSK